MGDVAAFVAKARISRPDSPESQSQRQTRQRGGCWRRCKQRRECGLSNAHIGPRSKRSTATANATQATRRKRSEPSRERQAQKSARGTRNGQRRSVQPEGAQRAAPVSAAAPAWFRSRTPLSARRRRAGPPVLHAEEEAQSHSKGKNHERERATQPSARAHHGVNPQRQRARQSVRRVA